MLKKVYFLFPFTFKTIILDFKFPTIPQFITPGDIAPDS